MNRTYVPYLALALMVLVAKVLQAWVDAAPLLFLGDSETYISSAVEGFTPICRSFVYGWPIRWWGLNNGSIMGLVIAQIVAGGITAWLVGAALLYFYHVRFRVAGVMTMVFAFDPLQILHERMVLAETFALLFFALQLVLALSYLRRPRLVTLVSVCGLGLVVVSLRIMFVPVVLAMAVLLPVGAWLNQPCARRRTWWGPGLVHLVLAVSVTAALHGAYRQHIGKAFGGWPPAYQYYDGLMLLAAWAPILQPGDATEPLVAELLKQQADDPDLPLDNRLMRESQLWANGGLVERLKVVFEGNALAANTCAKRVCRAALRRDPGAVLRLAWQSFGDYAFRWDRHGLRLWSEQGSDRQPSAPFQALLRERLAWNAAEVHSTPTPSKRFHLMAGPWYVFLFFSPLLWLATVAGGSSFERISGLLLFGFTALLVAVLCATGATTVLRYLHPFSFTALLAAGVLAERALTRRAGPVA